MNCTVHTVNTKIIRSKMKPNSLVIHKILESVNRLFVVNFINLNHVCSFNT